MGLKKPKLNINGELVEFRNIKKIVELLTVKQRNVIQKLKDDVVDVDKQKVACKKFEDLGKKLKAVSEILSVSTFDKKDVFSERVPLPVGMSAGEFISYVDVNIDSDYKGYGATISLQPKQLALPQKWQSVEFSSKFGNVTQPVSGTNNNLFTAGSFDILMQNNALTLSQNFVSKLNIVGSNQGQILPGRFFINDMQVNVTANDSLTSIATKISNLNVGINASAEQDTNSGYVKLILRTAEGGAENALTLDDPNGVFSKLTTNPSGGFTDRYKEYKTVTITAGDNLERIASKINSVENDTKLHADVFQIGHNRYVLILKSSSPGIDNAFEIIDNNVVMNGSNSGSVLNDVFNYAGCVKQVPQDALLDVDGIDISSVTNQFKIYDGLKINVKSIPSKTLAFEVKQDINAIFKAVSEFVEKYNLFRQAYEGDSVDEKNLRKSYAIKNDVRVSNMFAELDRAIDSIVDLDIGISRDSIEVEVKEDGKDIKREYKNMMRIDAPKLFDAINNDPEKIQRAFELSFESSSSNFIRPLIPKKISINSKNLGTNKIDIDVDINIDRITVKSKSSVVFSNTNNVVDAAGSDSRKFKPGTFWINGSAVNITTGMSLQQVVDAINGASQISRISASVNGNYMSFTEYSGSFKALDDQDKFKNMNLYDPNGVLQDVFSVYIKTDDFDVSYGSEISTKIDNSKSIVINGISVTSTTNTVDALVEAINSVSGSTGIVAKTVFNPNTGKLQIQFDTKKLQGITIDNSSGCISSSISIPTLETQQTYKEFFDTSKAVESSVKINDRNYNKKCILSMNGDDIISSGMLSIINNDGQTMKVENLEILFLGGVSESTHITISEGIAGNAINELDNVFKIASSYKSSKTSIVEVMESLDRKKEEINNELKLKEKYLSEKEKSLTARFSKAISVFDEQEAYNNLARALMGMKEDD